MSFEDNIESLQKILKLNGYENVRKYVDISSLVRDKSVYDCEIIARKDDYDILYLEAKSNWRGIATDVARQQNKSCLVITGYGETHLILSTVKDYVTNPKPRHVVIDLTSKAHSFDKFAGKIKATQDDDMISIDEKVNGAFDVYVEYKEALNEFGKHLRNVIKHTKDAITQATKNNKKYNTHSQKFLEMCRHIISGKLKSDDVEEMLLQHILTYRIFALIYDEHEISSTNAVARSLEGIVDTLGINTEQTSAGYQTINLVAESIVDSAEKQDFLKRVYETFYTEYDPKNKDSWGIAYTPSEVVDFMVRSTDHLLKKHFGKSISDDCVTLLDPATGTGTFITSIMRHLEPDRLKAKYKNDIFANDISVLAYYIAALNIENTYQEITGKIKEFENICWMDTLTTGTKDFGKVSAYFEEQDNVKRISRQQIKDICVVLGNPPYNAVQVSFNDANPSDKYPDIDKRIEETYVKNSSVGNKDKQYDMYKRFFRWSSDRIRNSGMVVFVTNNSFLDANSDDGFRRSVFEEFDYIYTINLKGNARTSGEHRRKQAGNVFRDTIKVGITISFLIKTNEDKSEIHYAEIGDYLKSQDKLKWLTANSFSTLQTDQIMPDEDANWLNQTDNDFDELIPVINHEFCVFKSLSMGSISSRNEWAFDFNKKTLEEKIKYFVAFYNSHIATYSNTTKSEKEIAQEIDKKIKWTRGALNSLKQGTRIKYSKTHITPTLYRPFVIKHQYFDKIIIQWQRKFLSIFKDSKPNMLIGFPNPKINVAFHTLAVNKIIDYDCLNNTQCIYLYAYDKNGKRHTNVTKFGLELFQKHYKNKKITNKDIFYYTYAIFNDPKYQEKYKFNLQRKFPRIPLAKNFDKWVQMGRKLYDLHVGFEDARPYPLKRTYKKTIKNNTKLRLEKPKNDTNDLSIVIDDQTTLEGIPKNVLEYKFSSKCALEWILEFYKESKNEIKEKSCDDPKIREKFNTYKFVDYKEHVIDLLQKVTTVSIDTVKIRSELEEMPWGSQLKLDFINSKNSGKDDQNIKLVPKIKPNPNPKKTKNSKIKKKAKRTAKQMDSLDGTGQTRLI